jgi:hypothetical protein
VSLSTPALETTLRTRLLTHPRLGGGATLAELLGSQAGAGADGKLYRVQAPDNVTTATPSRWAVMWLKNRRTNAENAQRDLAELEVMLFARPRNQQDALERAADACDEAMLRYQERIGDGLVGCWGRSRSTMPPFTEPADREVVQIRLAYTLVIYPEYLTQYADAV